MENKKKRISAPMILFLTVLLQSTVVAENTLVDGIYATPREVSCLIAKTLEVRGDSFILTRENDPFNKKSSTIKGTLLKRDKSGIEIKCKEGNISYQAVMASATLVLIPTNELKNYLEQGIVDVNSILIFMGSETIGAEAVKAGALFKKDRIINLYPTIVSKLISVFRENDFKEYEKQVAAARALGMAELVKDLLIAQNTASEKNDVTELKLILNDTFGFKSYARKPSENQSLIGLRALIENLTLAKDLTFLEEYLLIIMDISKMNTLEINLVDYNAKIFLELDDGVRRYKAERFDFNKDYLWTDIIKPVSKICQRWCRSKVSNILDKSSR